MVRLVPCFYYTSTPDKMILTLLVYTYDLVERPGTGDHYYKFFEYEGVN